MKHGVIYHIPGAAEISIP